MGEGTRALGQDVAEDLAIALAAGIFPISGLVGVVGQVAGTELMGLANFHAPQAREVGFGLVVVCAVIGPVLALVIDPPHGEVTMQQVVGVGLVGGNDRPRGDETRGQGADVGLVLAPDHEAQGPARAAGPRGARALGLVLTQDQDTTPVRTLVLGQSPIDAVFLLVLRAHVAAHIGAVDFDLTDQRGFLALHDETLAQLVHQHEGGLVLHPQVTAHLQGRKALDSIGIDRHRAQIHLQRQLVVGEDRPGGHREGVGTGLAAPLPPTGQEPVTLHNPACGTDHVLALSPTQFSEQVERPLIAEQKDLPHR